MSLEDRLNMIFKQFISSSVSNDLLMFIKNSIKPADVETLIKMVGSLDDPSAYCKHDLDNETVSGFFLFIDFISALIIDMGDSAIQKANNYSNIKHPFVPWVIKYANDERFHNEIMSKFSRIFAE